VKPLRQCRKCKRRHPETEEFYRALPDGGWAITCLLCRRTLGGGQVNAVTKYGISKKQYQKFLDRVCALCGDAHYLAIDHCHTTGRVRDVLCTGCNTGLGSFKDRPDLLRLAAEYVEDHAKRHYWDARHEEYWKAVHEANEESYFMSELVEKLPCNNS